MTGQPNMRDLRQSSDDALKAFRRILAVTSEMGGAEHDFRPTTVGAIRRIAQEQIVRLEVGLEA